MSYLVRVQLAHNWGGVDPAVAMTVTRAIREMMTKTNNPDKVIRCDNESGVSYSRGDGCDPACVVAFDCLLNE